MHPRRVRTPEGTASPGNTSTPSANVADNASPARFIGTASDGNRTTKFSRYLAGVRQYRKARGLTQKVFAGQLGVGQVGAWRARTRR
jgi:hypothetical protein